MARKGKKIKLKEVQEGDLLFFRTKNRRHAINHVGLVTKSNSKTLEFIHATTSKGVITSKFSDDYWNKAFVEARRIL
jgi:cell wall-associated NlpC family hydrolase